MNQKKICPKCSSKNTSCIGHGGYKQGPNGMGDKITMMGYQCSDCQYAWSSAEGDN